MDTSVIWVTDWLTQCSSKVISIQNLPYQQFSKNSTLKYKIGTWYGILSICILSGIGPGWMSARINSEAELDFIRESQKGLSDTRSYWIGGSSLVRGAIDLSNYTLQDQGSGKFFLSNHS